MREGAGALLVCLRSRRHFPAPGACEQRETEARYPSQPESGRRPADAGHSDSCIAQFQYRRMLQIERQEKLRGLPGDDVFQGDAGIQDAVRIHLFHYSPPDGNDGMIS